MQGEFRLCRLNEIFGTVVHIFVFDIAFGKERLGQSKFLDFSPALKFLESALEGDKVGVGAGGVVQPEKSIFGITADTSVSILQAGSLTQRCLWLALFIHSSQLH